MVDFSKKEYRNVFKEIGKTDEEIKEKLESGKYDAPAPMLNFTK